MSKFTEELCEVDIEMMSRAIGSVHSGTVEVVLSPHGTGFNGGVTVTCRMNLDVLPGSSLPATVVVVSEWPCKDCKTFWGHVFNGLYQLDQAVGKVYEQKSLWK